MKLRYIDLNIESNYYSGINEDFIYKFSFNVEFICHYMSKAVRKDRNWHL